MEPAPAGERVRTTVERSEWRAPEENASPDDLAVNLLAHAKSFGEFMDRLPPRLAGLAASFGGIQNPAPGFADELALTFTFGPRPNVTFTAVPPFGTGFRARFVPRQP